VLLIGVCYDRQVNQIELAMKNDKQIAGPVGCELHRLIM
jgi:hypothetical protein